MNLFLFPVSIKLTIKYCPATHVYMHGDMHVHTHSYCVGYVEWTGKKCLLLITNGNVLHLDG